jgi:dolichol-phosphate mannosyltransferase
MTDRKSGHRSSVEAGTVPPPAPETAPGVASLCLIVPTLNERDNIDPLLVQLEAALAGIEWEIIFVDDDSRDGTTEHIQALARRDRRVRCLHRIERRGLSTACIEGILASTAPFVAVMDADLQHDETLLPRMLGALEAGMCDLVIGSRYVEGGSIGDWGTGRARLSTLATRLGRLVLKAEIADPMSGFFMLRREFFDQSVRQMSGLGFKILIDLFVSSPTPPRFIELPYDFRQRRHGATKLDSMVGVQYLMLLWEKLFGHIVPVRFLLFSLVGTLGLLVHLSVLRLGLIVLPFAAAQGTATAIAMIGNFSLNNILTYRDRRLRGRRFVVGLLSFCLVCAVGAIANVGVADFLYAQNDSWWLAGLAGALVSSIWNYCASSALTWHRRK